MLRNILGNRVVAVSAGAVLVIGLGAGGAVAQGKITDEDISNFAVRKHHIGGGQVGSFELRRGAVQANHIAHNAVGWRDLRPWVQDQLKDGSEINNLRQEVTGLESRVATLESELEAAETAAWEPMDAGGIVMGSTVRLEKVDSNGSSVETQTLDMDVEAGDKISFTYALAEGSTCTAGAPRMFVTVDGALTNSWDQQLTAEEQCGTPNEDGSHTVTFTADDAGTIGHAGLVWDNGQEGPVLFSDVTVAGEDVAFE